MSKKFNITVCSSGNGGNFQVLIDKQEIENYKINLFIADRSCGAIERAVNSNIEFKLLNKKELGGDFFNAMLEAIPDDTNLVVLAGFMTILNKEFCKKWKGKIINTHPSLLPKYGGKGMYGVRIQQAVMNAGEMYAGCTVHYVDEQIDHGEIILQQQIEVDYNETPWQLGGRIFKEEGKLLIRAIQLIKSKQESTQETKQGILCMPLS